MSYSIIFETKVVKLKDGRLLHLSLSGCNNDTEGRSAGDWNGKIYTKEAFIEYAEGFKEDSKPYKEVGSFDIKIGSRYCTMYDYGEHLLRMMKRAVTMDELRQQKYTTFNRIDGVTVTEDGKMKRMSLKEFDDYYLENKYSNKKITYRLDYTLLVNEEDIVKAFDNGDSVSIYIKKRK